MTEPFDTGDASGRFLLTILAGVADLARSSILDRMWLGANRAAAAGSVAAKAHVKITIRYKFGHSPSILPMLSSARTPVQMITSVISTTVAYNAPSVDQNSIEIYQPGYERYRPVVAYHFTYFIIFAAFAV
jgi:hypothetical protein